MFNAITFFYIYIYSNVRFHFGGLVVLRGENIAESNKLTGDCGHLTIEMLTTSLVCKGSANACIYSRVTRNLVYFANTG